MLQTISNIGNIPHLSNSDPESNISSKVNFNYFDIHKFHSFVPTVMVSEQGEVSKHILNL